MGYYEQTGKKICTGCKAEQTSKTCKICGSETKASGKWSVRFYITQHNKRIEKRLSGFSTKKEAQNAMREFLNKHLASDTKTEQIIFNQLFNHYEENYLTELKETSYTEAIHIFKNHILPYFRDDIVQEITKRQILDYKELLTDKKLSHSYKCKIFTYLNALISYGVKNFDIKENVVAKIGNYKNSRKRKTMRFWTETEFEQFISFVDDKLYKLVFYFLYLTGCRKGEMQALQWSDINLDNKTVNVSKTYNTKINKVFDTPKNISSIRTILLPHNLNEKLKSYYEEEKPKQSNFVFGNERTIPSETLRRKLKEYCKISGVKEIRVHDLRHSHASLLINKGQNILIVAQRLGHSDIAETLNTYTHLFPSTQTEIINAININVN